MKEDVLMSALDIEDVCIVSIYGLPCSRGRLPQWGSLNHFHCPLLLSLPEAAEAGLLFLLNPRTQTP